MAEWESGRADVLADRTPECTCDQLALAVRPCFLQDRLEVVAHRVRREEHPRGDLTIEKALEHERRQLALAGKSAQPSGTRFPTSAPDPASVTAIAPESADPPLSGKAEIVTHLPVGACTRTLDSSPGNACSFPRDRTRAATASTAVGVNFASLADRIQCIHSSASGVEAISRKS